MNIPTTSQFAHTFAVVAISVGYILTIIIYGVLIILLHDGEQTTTVVNALNTMAYVGVGALVFIVTGRNVLAFLTSSATPTPANVATVTSTGGIANESATTS